MIVRIVRGGLGLVLIWVLVSAAGAWAEETAKKVDFGGSFRVRAEDQERTDYVNSKMFTLLRVRPSATFRPIDEVTVVFEPQFARVLGEQVTVPSSTTANTTGDGSGSTTDPFLNIHQAYASYKVMDGGMIAVGRQILKYGDELVIGALEWNNTGRAFDAVKIQAKYSLGFTDLLAAKIVETGASASGGGDKELVGFYHGWSFGSALSEMDWYVLYLMDGRVGQSPQDLWTAGTRFKSKIEALDYRAEVTAQAGKHTQLSYQLDGELGMSFGDHSMARVAAGGFLATRDYNQLYPTAHKWLGYADLLGRRNVLGAKGQLTVRPLDKLSVDILYHLLMRKDADGAVYKTTGVAWAANSTSKNLGNELDLTVKYTVMSGTSVTAGASMFLSGAYFKDQFGTTHPMFYYAQLDTVF